MKLERKSLIAAIERLKPAIQSSGSIPSLKNIWLDGKYGYAYNGALGIRTRWPFKMTPCGIPGGTLLGLLQSSSAKEVEFDQSGQTQVTLKMGRGSATIPMMDYDFTPWPFPAKVPNGPVGVRTLVLSKELSVGLKLVRVVKAAKPSRVEHHGVVLFPAKDVISLYSTDSISLAEIRVKGKATKELAKAVLPYGFIAQLLELEDITISFTKDAIMAEGEDILVCSNLLDTSSVWDLPKLVDQTIDGHGGETLLPKEFGEALDRAGVLASSEKEEAYLRFSTSNKELTVAGTFSGGHLEEKFPLKAVADTARVTVRLDHLKAIYKEAKEFAISDKALILFGKGDSLFLISAHEEKR